MERKSIKQLLKNERGAALATALLIMIALALIGAAALITSTMELDISRNERLAKEAFYVADGGTTLSPLIIEETIEIRALPDLEGINLNGNLYRELMGFETETDSPDPNNNPDVRTEVNNKDMTIDIDRIATQILAGGAAEFAGGYEGIGAGAASGGIAIFYRVDSEGGVITGTPPNQKYINRSTVETYYRKVVNIAQGE